MNKSKSLLILFLVLGALLSAQEEVTYSILETPYGEIMVPGIWDQMNTMEESGQTFLKNQEGVIIGIAKNPMKAYPFYIPKKSGFENVVEFYKWDSDYQEANSFKTTKLKENPQLEYIIWKYNDGKLDNVYLFGTSKSTFLNLLIYTDKWPENQKMEFLESIFKYNK